MRSEQKLSDKICPGGGMVDTADLKSAAERRTGSSPVPGTNNLGEQPWGCERIDIGFLVVMDVKKILKENKQWGLRNFCLCSK